jgi:hypothetical protein
MAESMNEALRSRYQQFFATTISTGSSASFSIEPYMNHSIQTVLVSGTATVNYRVTIDGTTFTQVASHTATTLTAFSGKYRSIVCNISAISGTVSAHIFSGL